MTDPRFARTTCLCYPYFLVCICKLLGLYFYFLISTFVFIFSWWWVLPEPYFIFHPPNHPTNSLFTHSIQPNINVSTHTVPCWLDSMHNRIGKKARGIPHFQVSSLHAVSCLSMSSLLCCYYQPSFFKVLNNKSGSHCFQENWWALEFPGS